MSKMRYQHGKRVSARPKINKLVNSMPLYVLYKPSGVSKDSMETKSLAVEEMEALKLKDVEDLDQSEAAKEMGVSRSTFQRLVKSARKKLISAIFEGKAIKFEGGNYIANENIVKSKCSKGGSYHFLIKKGEVEGQEYKISNIKCPKCGKRLIDFY